jgi:hypothetical protein
VPSSPLATVTRFIVPVSLLDQTLDVLTDAGQHGHEAFVLWGGRVDTDDATVLRFTTAIEPEQTAHIRPDGLLVTVEGSALFEVNQQLYARGELLAGQVHSHPTDAYHSAVDDHNPLVTLLGSLSLVIPYFGRDGRNAVNDWAWYRLIGEGRWAELTRNDRVQLVHDQ